MWPSFKIFTRTHLGTLEANPLKNRYPIGRMGRWRFYKLNSTMMTTIVKILVSLLLSLPICAQSILDERAQNTNFPIQERLSTEKILRISNSKRIFIVSLENKGFSLGDYITIIHKDRHVLRAIVAKAQDGKAGIKIIKIYSPPLWDKLREGLKVSILRGDDSYFVMKAKDGPGDAENSSKDDRVAKILSEDDLFNKETFLKEDLDSDERRNSLIPADDIISSNTGLVATVDLEGSPTTDIHFNFSWGHQLAPNIWGEISYGFSNLKRFPDDNLVTPLQTFIIRTKYTFSAPLYSFIKPYMGYKVSVVNALPPDITKDKKTPEQQAALIKEVERSGIIVGMTVLKRLVPGWFARFDLGTDLVNVGVALEF